MNDRPAAAATVGRLSFSQELSNEGKTNGRVSWCLLAMEAKNTKKYHLQQLNKIQL